MLGLHVLVAILLAVNPNPDTSLEAQLRQELVGAPRMLRHFYAADKLKFDAAGNPLNQEPAISWTLAGALVIERVTLETNKLELQGHRRLITFDQEHKRLGFAKWDKKVSIETATAPGPNQAGQIHDALAKVFVELDQLPNLLPDYWRDYMARFEGKQTGGCQEAEASVSGADKPLSATSQGIVEGRLVKVVEPHYLPAARQAGIQGEVQLRALITKTGEVTNICLQRALGGGMDDAVIETVRQWRYSAYLLNGQPIDVKTTISMKFH